METIAPTKSFAVLNLSAETLSSLDTMGYKAPTVMIDLIQGKKVDDPVFTGLDECTRETADTCIQK